METTLSLPLSHPFNSLVETSLSQPLTFRRFRVEGGGEFSHFYFPIPSLYSKSRQKHNLSKVPLSDLISKQSCNKVNFLESSEEWSRLIDQAPIVLMLFST